MNKHISKEFLDNLAMIVFQSTIAGLYIGAIAFLVYLFFVFVSSNPN
jgi:uncharacterized membrane protein